MRNWGQAAAIFALALTGIGAAQAESGSFFKNMFGGVGTSSGGQAPSLSGPKLQDPKEAYCPQIDVRDGAAAVQAFAGAAGDNSRLRHQLTFGQMSRECTVRAGGAVGVRVGVQIRALLGPAGAPGTFDAPLTVSLKYNDKVVASQTRRVPVAIPAGGAQGQASVVADELIVPADMAVGYDIEVALAGAPARAKPPAKSAARRAKPTPAEAAAAPAAAQ
ncbi:hypothetical protein [Methylobacterium haplocladii]|uniref:Uncharacterized protein n=1 Tax=Methylobacterium haplocladii TaxID=1176176 RepID=A0A512ILH8_9HYPH|nr:hypothetical protein [Methylobacterium haplocladii]GEO98559.1 hypothetical protein MHA02_09470 [Methylobacterium haplocladii]GJD85160.1 hypothetical protein HPGCJGGD_3046 [Methylobacterium haplocladii]GLS59905.1 hypothetical protein GCM10007887_25780 [Methylobacterium haplocladii]